MSGHDAVLKNCVRWSSRKESQEAGGTQGHLHIPCFDSAARPDAGQPHAQSSDFCDVPVAVYNTPGIVDGLGDCTSGDSDGSHQPVVSSPDHRSPSLDKVQDLSGSVWQTTETRSESQPAAATGSHAERSQGALSAAEGLQQQKKPVQVQPVQHSSKSSCALGSEVAATNAIKKNEALEAAAAAGPTSLASPAPPRNLSSISPLPPPSPSEGKSIQAEYQHYLQRFEEGDTLAQRWQRLKDKGLWEHLKEEWEEWQDDLLLQELQANNADRRAGTGKGRKRREHDPADVELETRKTRARRAPATLQDYQVDTPLSVSPAPGATHGDQAASGNKTLLATGTEGNGRRIEGRDTQPSKRSSRESAPRVVERRVYYPQQEMPCSMQSFNISSGQIVPYQQGASHLGQPQQQQQQRMQHSEQASAHALMQQMYHLGAQLRNVLQQGYGTSSSAGLSGVEVDNSAYLAAAMEAVCMRIFDGDANAMRQEMAAAMRMQ